MSNYLDCGCCIDDEGTRHWCPSCESPSRPLPPAVLVDALQDAVHQDTGPARAARKTYAQGVADERARIEAEVELARVEHAKNCEGPNAVTCPADELGAEILRRIRDKERPT